MTNGLVQNYTEIVGKYIQKWLINKWLQAYSDTVQNRRELKGINL